MNTNLSVADISWECDGDLMTGSSVLIVVCGSFFSSLCGNGGVISPTEAATFSGTSLIFGLSSLDSLTSLATSSTDARTSPSFIIL